MARFKDVAGLKDIVIGFAATALTMGLLPSKGQAQVNAALKNDSVKMEMMDTAVIEPVTLKIGKTTLDITDYSNEKTKANLVRLGQAIEKDKFGKPMLFIKWADNENEAAARFVAEDCIPLTQLDKDNPTHTVSLLDGKTHVLGDKDVIKRDIQYFVPGKGKYRFDADVAAEYAGKRDYAVIVTAPDGVEARLKCETDNYLNMMPKLINGEISVAKMDTDAHNEATKIGNPVVYLREAGNYGPSAPRPLKP